MLSSDILHKNIFDEQSFPKQLQVKYLQCQQIHSIWNLKRCRSNFNSAFQLFYWNRHFLCHPALFDQCWNLLTRPVYAWPGTLPGPCRDASTCEENNTFPECPWGTNLGDRHDPGAPSRNPGILLTTCQKKMCSVTVWPFWYKTDFKFLFLLFT